MQVLHDTFIDDPNVTVVAVNIDDSSDPLTYLQQGGFTFRHVVKGESMKNSFGVRNIPTFVVINPEGRVIHTHVGSIDEATRLELEIIARDASR